MTQKKALQNPAPKVQKSAAEDLLKVRAELESVLVKPTAELERLEKVLVDVADRESQRLSQELHDTLCQQLLGAAFCAEALAQRTLSEPGLTEGLRDLAGLISSAVEQARQITHGLESNINESDLGNALQTLVGAAGRRMKGTLEYPKPVSIPNVETALHIYRIAQEAISNAVQHSGGSHLVVRMYEGKKSVFLEVEDDGRGCAESMDAFGGIGLTLMRIRARSIRAKLVFQTARKGGICVHCVVPK